MEEFVKKIHAKMKPTVTGFNINRIPKKELSWFINFAKEEFENDRGFALKHLIDFYIGLIPSGVEHLQEQIIDLQKQLDEIKTTTNKQEEPSKRIMMDGSIKK